MYNHTYNHQFLCKLLGICANHAIIEGAYQTQDIIQNISELIRYIYDIRILNITFEEEFTTVKNYLDIYNMRGMNRRFTAEIHGNVENGKYIQRLSILTTIIDDIEENFNGYEESIDIKYIFKCNESEIILVRNPDDICIAAIKLVN